MIRSRVRFELRCDEQVPLVFPGGYGGHANEPNELLYFAERALEAGWANLFLDRGTKVCKITQRKAYDTLIDSPQLRR